MVLWHQYQETENIRIVRNHCFIGKFEEVNMLVVLMSIHIIGAIITIIIHCRDGTIEHASKYGDGFRFAKPSDVIFQDCLLWEIQLVIHTIIFVEDYINSKFSKHFH